MRKNKKSGWEELERISDKIMSGCVYERAGGNCKFYIGDSLGCEVNVKRRDSVLRNMKIEMGKAFS